MYKPYKKDIPVRLSRTLYYHNYGLILLHLHAPYPTYEQREEPPPPNPIESVTVSSFCILKQHFTKSKPKQTLLYLHDINIYQSITISEIRCNGGPGRWSAGAPVTILIYWFNCPEISGDGNQLRICIRIHLIPLH